MRLYFFPLAPNPTRVRLYLAEKRAAGGSPTVEEVQVNLLSGAQRAPDHLARNPMGKVPVLELADGSFLTESLAIIEYLVARWPEPSRIGRTPEERARVRELHPIARAVHATRSPLGSPPAPEVAAHALAALPDGLVRLAAVLADGRPFLAGEHPTVADCTLAAALQFARFGQLPLPSAGAVVEWDLRYRARAPARSVLSL